MTLCAALDLRTDIGEELARLARLAFRNTMENCLLHAMLFETKDITAEMAKKIMNISE